MAEQQNNLLETQRRFFAALREPVLAESRSRTLLPPRAGDVSLDFVTTANSLISPSKALHPVERLELYHRQYWYRLLDSLAEDFPTLQALLGEEIFWGLIESYLLQAAPDTYTLRHLGAGLADFIAATPRLPAGDQVISLSRPVLARELAGVEYALCLAFEAAERPIVSAGQLAQCSLALQPHLTLLALRSSADTLWRRHDQGHSLGSYAGERAQAWRYVAVYRLQGALYVERIPRLAYLLLRAIEARGSLDAAMQQVLEQGALKAHRERERIPRLFGQWMARGWLCLRDAKQSYVK